MIIVVSMRLIMIQISCIFALPRSVNLRRFTKTPPLILPTAPGIAVIMAVKNIFNSTLFVILKIFIYFFIIVFKWATIIILQITSGNCIGTINMINVFKVR